ncbi:MAG TPA: copper resistance CopC family protein [Gammaproteobacteria bacterium]|nr:copper resistance CopC family protein [Gammaproteobacteria bacterium]
MKRLLGLALALLLAAVANAHTPLKESSPAADASVPAPKAIVLTFGGDVRLTSVSLTDSTGAAKHLDAPPTATGAMFRIAVHEPLAPGAYKVVWRAVGGDTHIVSGELGFTVVAAPAQ